MAERTLDFTTPASGAQLVEVAERLRERNFEVLLDDRGPARPKILVREPLGV